MVGKKHVMCYLLLILKKFAYKISILFSLLKVVVCYISQKLGTLGSWVLWVPGAFGFLGPLGSWGLWVPGGKDMM